MRRDNNIPPQALDMEQCVLGAMLIERSAVERAAQLLRPEDFYRAEHGYIFQSILLLFERNDPIDLLTVQEQLKALPVYGNVLEQCNGVSYLAALTDKVPGSANIAYYARKVADAVVLRRLIAAGSEIHEIASRAASEDYETVSDVITEAMEVIERVQEVTEESSATGGEIGGDELPSAHDLPTLWFGLYAARSVLLLGETGAGKSSLLYNICLQASRNQPLWGISYAMGRPLNILYLDPENAGEYRDPNPAQRDGGLCRQKLDNIIALGDRVPANLRFMDAQNLDLSRTAHIRRLQQRIRRGWRGQPFDIVVFDPIITLFHVKNENDNAEMSSVGEVIRLISRRTGVCCIATHHTGKALLAGVLSGRGASAQSGPFDVVVTLRAQGKQEEDEDEEYTGETRVRTDVCRLRIEKDRPSMFGKGSSLYLRMGSPRLDCFERVTFEDWRAARKVENEEDGSKLARAKPFIRALLTDDDFHTRKEIHEEVRKSGNREIGRNNIDQALGEMQQSGEIESARMGGAMLVYRRVPEPLNPDEDPYAQ